MVRSRIPADRLKTALQTHIELLREEQARTAEIDIHIDETKSFLARLQKERAESVGRQAALVTTIAIYEDLADIESEAPRLLTVPEAMGEKQPPARIGAQRYRMLCAMRRLGHVRLQELAAYGGLEPRKAKFTLSADEKRGFVVLDDHGYCLTGKGQDLLKRFEDYRRENGLELPSLAPEEEGTDEEDCEPNEVVKAFKAARSGTIGTETSDDN